MSSDFGATASEESAEESLSDAFDEDEGAPKPKAKAAKAKTAPPAKTTKTTKAAPAKGKAAAAAASPAKVATGKTPGARVVTGLVTVGNNSGNKTFLQPPRRTGLSKRDATFLGGGK